MQAGVSMKTRFSWEFADQVIVTTSLTIKVAKVRQK